MSYPPKSVYNIRKGKLHIKKERRACLRCLRLEGEKREWGNADGYKTPSVLEKGRLFQIHILLWVGSDVYGAYEVHYGDERRF